MFTKVGMIIIGQQGLRVSVRPKKQAHKAFFKSLAEGRVDLPTQIDRITCCMHAYIRRCVHEYIERWRRYVPIRRAFGPGRDRSVLVLRPCLLPPFIPPGTLGPRSWPAWALLGSYRGSPERRGDPNGTPRTLQGRPRDPLGPYESSQ